MPHPAVFLDRDGTLIEDRGHLAHPEEAILFPDTIPALRLLRGEFRLFIVTHQPGIALGHLRAADAQRINRHVVDTLADHGIEITDVYCCPHQRGDSCNCIKPKPLFLRQAAAEYDLDLSQSFVIGDHPHDVILAENAGATGVYVLTGHGRRHLQELPPGRTTLPGIREAVEWILACRRMRQAATHNPSMINDAARILQMGGLVAFPTETVYGLGADAFNRTAVARVFEAKQRPLFDPLIVHVANREQLEAVTGRLPAIAAELTARFWPGPLTLVVPKSEDLPDLVTAGLSTVAVRMPRHPMALALIRAAGTPLAAPSANPFGGTSPTCAGHVRDHLEHAVDLILDGGPATVGVESTILDLTCTPPKLLRPGGVPAEEIEMLTGPLACAKSDGTEKVNAPGMLPRHYAPRTPLRLQNDLTLPAKVQGKQIGAIAFRAIPDPARYIAHETLSPDGDLRESAANLFAAIRRLDRLGLDLIIAERVPDTGLGTAINDRLSRAAQPD